MFNVLSVSYFVGFDLFGLFGVGLLTFTNIINKEQMFGYIKCYLYKTVTFKRSFPHSPKSRSKVWIIQKNANLYCDTRLTCITQNHISILLVF